MATHELSRDQAIIVRYTDQPLRLPTRVRRAIEDEWGDEPVQLYALGDLDASLKLATIWLAMGPTRLAVVRDFGDAKPFEVRTFARSKVHGVREAPGLSCNVLTIQGPPDEPALAVMRYSHRC